MEDKGKVIRVLDLYHKFMAGEPVNKVFEANHYGVNEKSIQRDIEDIRAYLERQEMEGKGIYGTVVYDRIEKAYRLEKIYDVKLSNSEVLAICKILLDARAFPKEQMYSMLDKLIGCCVPKTNQKAVKELVANEKFHYIEPQHKTDFLDMMWKIGQAIRNQNYIEITYQRTYDKKNVTRNVKPAAIMFSDFYFYVTAFIEDAETRSHFVLENEELGLDNPQKMCEFIVELHFACFEEVNSNINAVRKDLLGENIAVIKSVKDNWDYIKKNPEDKEERLKQSLIDLGKVSNSFIEKLDAYIGDIRKIDNRSKTLFFLFAILSLRGLDEKIILAKDAISWYIESISLLCMIGFFFEKRYFNIYEQSVSIS